jgi:membrane-bound serine protease (ClpP class)
MRRAVWWSIIGLLLSWLLVKPGMAQQGSPLALLLTADGPVAPPMVEYLKRGIELAETRNAEVIILQLNTPGGTIDSMNHIVQTIRGSHIPVVVYVAPQGSMAGSAGTMVVLAGHAAAMAPETAIGAASPVGSQGEDLSQTEQAKTKNILKATVRALAKDRGEQAIALAEQTIETAHAASAEEALNAGMIDFIATDVNDLLRQLDGFSVKIDNQERKLATSGAVIQEVNQSFIETLLAVLTNPAIVFLLITIGVQAILIEISSPGGWVAGTIGVVCLALAGYGLGVLPVNWFGVVFLILAFVLFILDIKAPTHGALTAAGVISLIVGSLVMFNSPSVPNFMRVPVPLIVGTSVMTGAIFFVIVIFAVRAQKTPVRVGPESLIGRVGTARGKLDPLGPVQLGGEQWTAELEEGEKPIPSGSRVEVVGVQGLRLKVRRASK